MHCNNRSDYLSDPHDSVFVNNVDPDVLKHVESLRTRLGFARFKLNNGWENNTLGDVECFWKKRQRQLINEIPMPRFTQQDIIDKRSYIPASGARQAKARQAKLLKRSFSISAQVHPKSTNSIYNRSPSQQNSKKARRKSHPPSQGRYTEDGTDSSGSSSYEFSLPYQLSHQHQHQTYFFHHYDKDNWAAKASNSIPLPTSNNRNHSVSSFDASCVPSDLNGEPSVVKNSLDFLSYAIAMTEKRQDQEETDHYYCRQRQNSDYLMEAPILLDDEDEEDEETDLNVRDDVSSDWTKTSQLRLSLSIPNQLVEDEKNNDLNVSSVSETNVAARAMMMLVNRE